MLINIGSLPFVVHFVNIWRTIQQLLITFGSPTEEHFHINGYASKHNMHVWGIENPHTVMDMPLHPQKCMAWCAISCAGIVGPVFLDDRVNAECYTKFLQDLFVLTL
jgi:hypothetical protein